MSKCLKDFVAMKRHKKGIKVLRQLWHLSLEETCISKYNWPFNFVEIFLPFTLNGMPENYLSAAKDIVHNKQQHLNISTFVDNDNGDLLKVNHHDVIIIIIIYPRRALLRIRPPTTTSTRTKLMAVHLRYNSLRGAGGASCVMRFCFIIGAVLRKSLFQPVVLRFL